VFQVMRSLFAALLLLFQLQPVLGTAACLGLVRQPVQEECRMPEHGRVPTHSLTQTEPLASQTCALAAVCAPTPLAVPAFAGQLVRVASLHPAPAIAGTNSPADIFSAPPFHPPKV
jgi:hypothetical protein